jgi:hypothetical protein
MKKLAALLLLMICCNLGFANDPETKTFLVLFKAKELKELKTNLKQIESQFSFVFKTKIYSGNSELALFIEIPNCDFDECFLGEFLVDLENGEKLQLQNIAFRLFDLTANQELHQAYVAMYEDVVARKKNSKSARNSSISLSGPGH